MADELRKQKYADKIRGMQSGFDKLNEGGTSYREMAPHLKEYFENKKEEEVMTPEKQAAMDAAADRNAQIQKMLMQKMIAEEQAGIMAEKLRTPPTKMPTEQVIRQMQAPVDDPNVQQLMQNIEPWGRTKEMIKKNGRR